jgi:hypothetical protein
LSKIPFQSHRESTKKNLWRFKAIRQLGGGGDFGEKSDRVLMCFFTFALISSTTQNTCFFELSNKWGLKKKSHYLLCEKDLKREKSALFVNKKKVTVSDSSLWKNKSTITSYSPRPISSLIHLTSRANIQYDKPKLSLPRLLKGMAIST